MWPETIFLLAAAVAVAVIVMAVRKSRRRRDVPKEDADRLNGGG